MLFEISYLWYTLAGLLITLMVGITVSFLYGFNDPRNVDKRLLTPIIHKFLPTNSKVCFRKNFFVLKVRTNAINSYVLKISRSLSKN